MHTVRSCIVFSRLKDVVGSSDSRSVCWQAVTRDSGHALVTTLGLALCSAVIAGTLQTMVMFQARTLQLYDASRQSFWLARGAALSVLAALEANPAAVGTTRTVETAGGVVKESVSFGTSDSVRIEATVPGAVNTVVFSYDPSAKRVTQWQDNSP